MFTDPLSVTFNGSATSLARVSADEVGTTYATPDRSLVLEIFEVSVRGSGQRRIECKLSYAHPDPTPDPFSGGPASQINSVGLVFEVNPNGFYSGTDVPLLRTAILALVDSTFQGRVLGGEK
jgi:hypothetical protein